MDEEKRKKNKNNFEWFIFKKWKCDHKNPLQAHGKTIIKFKLRISYCVCRPTKKKKSVCFPIILIDHDHTAKVCTQKPNEDFCILLFSKIHIERAVLGALCCETTREWKPVFHVSCVWRSNPVFLSINVDNFVAVVVVVVRNARTFRKSGWPSFSDSKRARTQPRQYIDLIMHRCWWWWWPR